MFFCDQEVQLLQLLRGRKSSTLPGSTGSRGHHPLQPSHPSTTGSPSQRPTGHNTAGIEGAGLAIGTLEPTNTTSAEPLHSTPTITQGSSIEAQTPCNSNQGGLLARRHSTTTSTEGLVPAGGSRKGRRRMGGGQEKLMTFKEELKNYQFWKAVRCEFLITMLYVFIGCGCSTVFDPDDSPSELKVALGFGLGAATLVQCVGHISGAHLNPAVTMATLVTRNVTVLRAVCYVMAQLIGATVGAGILYGVTPKTAHGSLGVTSLHPHLGLGQAFGVEFMVTFVVVFTVFANLEPRRSDMGSRSLSIGLAVLLGHLFAFQYTGASMNPARSLGPAIVMNSWKNHWVYWVGPLLGGIIGGFTYEYTHDSSGQLTTLRRSFRRRSAGLKRTRSTHSTNSTHSTEMTYTPTSEDMRI